MTPEQLAARIRALAGRPVRVRPDLAAAPYTWSAVVRGRAAPAATIAAQLDDVAVEAGDDRLVVTLSDSDVLAALDRATEVAERITRNLAGSTAVVPDATPLRLTRDGGRVTTYAALADEVGAVSARWAVFRSADGRQIDCAATDLATLTPCNPVLPALLAVSRLSRTPAWEPPSALAALVAEWPLVLDDARRTGRTRPVAQHVERMAAEVVRWHESGQGSRHGSASASPARPAEVGSASAPLARPAEDGAAPAVWTGEQLARTGRIVLVAGLAMAGIPEPTRI